jgi:thioredoxin 2
MSTHPALHIVCPLCQAANRLPESRMHDRPNCGACHQPLFSGQPISLTDENFQRHIDATDIPVLVDFWAPWCGPCKAMAPVLELAAHEMEPHMRIAKVNSDENPKTSVRYRICSIPTLILFKNGNEVKRTSGAMDLRELRHWINEP